VILIYTGVGVNVCNTPAVLGVNHGDEVLVIVNPF
jgi:hypothetical protein